MARPSRPRAQTGAIAYRIRRWAAAWAAALLLVAAWPAWAPAARAADPVPGMPGCLPPAGCDWTGTITVKGTAKFQEREFDPAFLQKHRTTLSITGTYGGVVLHLTGNASAGTYAAAVTAGELRWSADSESTVVDKYGRKGTAGGSGSGTLPMPDPKGYAVLNMSITPDQGGTGTTLDLSGNWAAGFPPSHANGIAANTSLMGASYSWRVSGKDTQAGAPRRLKGSAKSTVKAGDTTYRYTVTWDLQSNAGYRVQGLVRACPPDAACDSQAPAPGVRVVATGRTSAEATTDADGRYTMDLPSGTYIVGPADDSDRSVPHDRRVELPPDASGVDFQVCTQGGDGFVPCSSLEVKVAVSPKDIVVPQAADGPVPVPVDVKVTLTNIGDRALHGVTLDRKLLLGYEDITHADQLPLVPLVREPGLETIGALEPDQPRDVTIRYQAISDGNLDITALVTYALDPLGATLTSTGTTHVGLRTQALVATMALGRTTDSARNPGLIAPGSQWTVRVKLENRSYIRRLLVWGGTALKGNLDGGHWQPPDLALGPPDQSVAGCTLPPLVSLEPRQTSEWEIVYRVVPSDPRTATSGGVNGTGGTRAQVTLLQPLAWQAEGDEAEPEPLPAGEIAVLGKNELQVSVDDSAPGQAAFSSVAAFAYFSKGQLAATVSWFGGLLHGIFIDLPVLIGKGILGTPSLVKKIVAMEVDLWQTVKDDPVLLAAYTNLVTNQMLLSLAEAPDAVKEGQAFWDKMNQAAYAHFEQMAYDWYQGDWRSAAETFGGDERTLELELAAALAPCVLARLPKVAKAAEAAKASRYAEASEELAAQAGRRTSAVEATRILAGSLEPGMPLSDALLRHIFGLTQEEIDWLRSWIKGKDLLYTFRTRATETLQWIGAYLKPEEFKLKTVDWVDTEYLGYRYEDQGRLILRTPIDRAAVERQLINEGWGEGTKRWEDVMSRLDLREFEWYTDEAQYRRSMEAWNEAGEVDFRYNWGENLVDPSVAPTGKPTRAGFRLRERVRVDPLTKEIVTDSVVEVDPDKTGAWRSVVGDVDGVALTDTAGYGLDDARHIRYAEELRDGALKSPHLETASWTHDGEFMFPDKLKYLTKGYMAQLGPDGVFRLVRFNPELSDMRSARDYFIWFDGGWIAP